MMLIIAIASTHTAIFPSAIPGAVAVNATLDREHRFVELLLPALQWRPLAALAQAGSHP